MEILPQSTNKLYLGKKALSRKKGYGIRSRGGAAFLIVVSEETVLMCRKALPWDFCPWAVLLFLFFFSVNVLPVFSAV